MEMISKIFNKSFPLGNKLLLAGFLFIFLLTASTVSAATRTASVDGDWNNTATWGGLSVPGPADSVIINSRIQVTVPSGYAAQCININFSAGRTADIILADATSSLTASGVVTLPRTSTNGNTNTINVGAGTFSAASINLQATTGTRVCQILISTGTATASGNITSLGTASKITFSGTGTLNAGGTFLSGTAGTFTAGTGTVNFYRAGAQTIAPFAYTFNNVTLSGSGVKTTTNATVNGILSIEGTATASDAPTYGAAATLRYNTATARNAGPEWLTPFAATGGVIIANAGAITLNAAKVFNASVPLTINSGSTLATGNFQLTLGGDFINNGGTFTGGSSPIVITDTMGTQSIAGFTTTGTVSMTKTAGTATFTGNVNGNGLTINGAGGTLNLGAGRTHTFTGACAINNGTLNGGSSTLNLAGNFNLTAGTFTAGTSSVVFQGAGSSTISGSNTFNNLSCITPSKSILVTAGTTQTVGGVFTINGGAVGTRVSLASTGGAGTTWNLVLNGSYFCQYVAVQGSNASGTASFPINPTGSLNNGDNTNWFPKYSVTYNGNGNTGGTAPVDGSSPYYQGATVTVLGVGTLTRTGFAFSGWNTAANGSGTSYAAGATFLMGTSPVILYAQWTALPISAVTYNGNGNDGGAVPVDGNSPYYQGDTVTVLDNINGLTKTGYIFSGWNTASDGSGTSYSPGATFLMGTSAVTLYAKWSTISFTVSGTIYTDKAKTSPIAAGKTVSLSVNGAAVTSTTTAAGGTFTFGLVTSPNPNDVLLVFLDGMAEKASLVTKTDGTTNLTGANALALIVDKIILQYQTGTSITNADLDVIDAVDPGDDDGITIAGGNATFAGGFEVIISSGKTYAPGGNITFYDMDVSGALSLTAGTVDISGSIIGTGAISPGTSTTNFVGANPVTLSGNLAFHNFISTVASKSFTVATGSTITANGLFRIDGSAFATRISFASSGGFGTTWNLVLNGTYDCRYVAVQGSTASGTAYLPINPVGFKDNGNNTNWYDPDLPAEMIFYDNFETSTLGSAPPDKISSNWTISNASWLDIAATTVNTQNHTTGGSMSMYSSGGSAGQGIGAWNYPAWGPATNCTAIGWFYDDMQNNKMQWLFLDNAAGTQGIGVLVDTTQSTTKYRYCRYNFGGGTIYTDSFIDRSLGWHKVRVVHTNGTAELYLDEALLMTATGLSDFSAFDTGSWNWHNTTGSTPMWFDDFMVYRSQNQSAYRWYDDDNAENPTPLAAENTAVTARDIGTTTRLRLQVQNNQYEDWSGAYIAIQYRKGTNGVWSSLGPSGDWDYADGLGTDQAQVANALLTNTNIRQQFVESVPSATNLTMTTNQYGEWDFCINSTLSATLATEYYFRFVITDAAGVYQRSLAAYDYYPQITLVSPTMTQWTGNANNNWSFAPNWTNGVPDATKDVIIQTSASRDCRIDISGAVCKSLVVQSGRAFLLDTAATDLTVTSDITVFGTVTHSNNTAVLNLNGGTLRIDTTGVYDHSGNGAVNAASATIQVINGGDYNVSGAPTITALTLNMAVGGFVNVTNAATFNLQNFTIDLNGQWLSSSTGNIVNLSNNFINNGSMLGSTGGDFRFTGASKTMSGTSTTTTFYRATFSGSMISSITNDVKVLNNLTINGGSSFTASSGKLYVGGNWANAGTFGHGNGTVYFNGTGLQQITAGGSDFYHLVQTNSSVAGVSFLDGFSMASLTNSTGNSKMTFNAGSTYNITESGGLTLTGTAGNLVTLVSSTPGTLWFINPSGGAWSVDYIAVSDSLNTYSDTIFPTNSADNGTTLNWFSADKDNDGLPDYWEYQYYGAIGIGADSDTDSDGLNALEEYIAGTNPTVPNVAVKSFIYVDDNAGYTGDGTPGAPYKYLKDALDNAVDGSLISLADGIYELDDYTLTKRVVIRGENAATKTIIQGAAPDGGSSDYGQMLSIKTKDFMLSRVTLQLFRDDKPIISYEVESGTIDTVIFDSTIFKDNTTSTKSMIAPSGIKWPKDIYLINCLFYGNDALSAAELKGKNTVNALNNTISDNTFGSALILSGSGKTYLVYNNILRNSSTELTDSSSATVTVSNCNIEGGYPGAISSYDTPETYANSALGYYNLLTGSAGINNGLTTGYNWDLKGVTRPQGPAYDVGAYETDPNDQDGDGLTNLFETTNGYDQTNPDSDGDSVTDGDEILVYGTNPNSTNTDSDFINDGDEIPMGMDPAVYDGVGDIDGVYFTSFESDAQFPVGPIANTIWGPSGNAASSAVIKGNVTIENVGAAAYDGVKVAKAAGQTPESSFIGWVDRNSLDSYWISIAWKTPRAKLPTDLNEAFNMAGSFMAIDENGYLNIWDPSNKAWLKDTQVTPDDWFVVTVNRDHPGKTVNVWIETRQVFAGVPISDPDPTAGTGKFRMSMSSVGEMDAFTDLWSALPYSPF